VDTQPRIGGVGGVITAGYKTERWEHKKVIQQKKGVRESSWTRFKEWDLFDIINTREG